MPFIAYWKGHTPVGKVIREPFSCLDIMPTLAAWTNTKLPQTTLDGEPVNDLLSGKEPKVPHAPIYYVNVVPEVVKVGEWKLRKTKTTLELFNLTQDPGERVNLVNKHPEKVRELQALLDKYLG